MSVSCHIALYLSLFLSLPIATAVAQQRLHSVMVPYDSKEKAARQDQQQSVYALSTDGGWRFSRTSATVKRPREFYKTTFSDSEWPLTDRPAAQGVYRKWIDLPAGWKGRDIFLSVKGITSPVVWINGERVEETTKYGDDIIVDITEHASSGKNLLALELSHTGTSSLFLYSKPAVHIRDFTLTAQLSPDFQTASLTADTYIQFEERTGKQRADLEITLLDPSGREIAVSPKTTLVSAAIGRGIKSLMQRVTGNERDLSVKQGSWQTQISQPQLWSAEVPVQYTVLFTLYNEQNEVTEILSSRLAFRKTEMVNGRFLVNGKPTELKGLRRTVSPAEPADSLRQEILRMKQHHVNAVFIGTGEHSVWRRLGDELGLYVLDSEKSPGIPAWPDASILNDPAEAASLKKQYEWITASPVHLAAGQIRVKNGYSFTDLAQFRIRWVLSGDGHMLQDGTLNNVKLAPGDSTIWSVPLPQQTLQTGVRYYLDLEFTADNGVLSRLQLPFPYQPVPGGNHYPADTIPDIYMLQNDDEVTFIGKDFHIGFDKSRGTISSLAYDNEQLIDTAGREQEAVQFEVTTLSSKTVRLDVAGEPGNKRYTVLGNGTIAVEMTAPAADTASIGIVLSPTIRQVEWLGRGPHAHHPRQAAGAFVGLYHAGMEDAAFSEVYRIKFTGARKALLVRSDRPLRMQLTALPDGTGTLLQLGAVSGQVSFTLTPGP